MKKQIACCLAALLSLAILLLIAYAIYPIGGDWLHVGCDFDLRVNEANCLITGVDPYDVWTGEASNPPFYSLKNADTPPAGCSKKVNAYPPYAYTFIAPLAILPTRLAWALYFLVTLTFLGIFVRYGFKRGKALRGDPAEGWIVSSGALLLSIFAIASCFQSGNYPIPLLAVLLGMIWCLDRKHDILAGCCWALLMIKPQCGLLFAVPLLLRRKFLTCATAAAICLLASVPAVILTGKSLIVLMREASNGSSGFFLGCGTWPYILCTGNGNSSDIIIALVIGAIVCTALTWLLRKRTDWFTFLMPAAVISTCWSYAQLYASMPSWIFFVLLLVELLKAPQSKVAWLFTILSALVVSRPYTFYHGASILLQDLIGYSYELHGHLDSINSMAIVLVVSAFCLWTESRETGDDALSTCSVST